jgi:hypothetical protein
MLGQNDATFPCTIPAWPVLGESAPCSIEAPRDSEGTAGCWAGPLVMESTTAFNPQSHGYRHGLLLCPREINSYRSPTR